MNGKIEWGKNKCWTCKGFGKIPVKVCQGLNSSDNISNDSQEYRECHKCGGTGLVPRR